MLLRVLLVVGWLMMAISIRAESSGRTDARPIRHVLVLASYHMTHSWTARLAEAIKRGTDDLPVRLDYNIVSLDALRNNNSADWARTFQPQLA